MQTGEYKIRLLELQQFIICYFFEIIIKNGSSYRWQSAELICSDINAFIILPTSPNIKRTLLKYGLKEFNKIWTPGQSPKRPAPAPNSEEMLLENERLLRDAQHTFKPNLVRFSVHKGSVAAAVAQLHPGVSGGDSGQVHTHSEAAPFLTSDPLH